MKRYITYCLGRILAALLAISPAVAVEYNVSAKGKDENTAEANAKVNAVRACMKELVTMDFLQANADAVRFEIILKSSEFVTSCNILEHKQDDTFISIQAVVDVDKDRLKNTLDALQSGTAQAATSSDVVDKR